MRLQHGMHVPGLCHREQGAGERTPSRTERAGTHLHAVWQQRTMQRPQPPKLVAVALLCADIKSHLIIANFTFTVKDAEVGARQRGDELFAELVQRPIAPMTPAVVRVTRRLVWKI